MSATDTTIDTTMPDHMVYFRLAQMKGALKLESAGMKVRQSPLRPKLAAEFGLTPRAPYEKFIAAIQAKMDEVIAARAAAAS